MKGIYLLFLAVIGATLNAGLIITEFLASNGSGLDDEDGNSSDWIEVHNDSPNAVNIQGWFLSDDAANLTKWRFPNAVIPGNGHLLVFASDKNRNPIGGELHTNFKLSSDGEYLALVRPDGVTVEWEYRPAFPEQTRDVSYGFSLDSSQYQYYLNPTPGEENSNGIAGFIGEIQFSVPHGLYDQGLKLSLSTDTPDSEIRYTLDGSEPNQSHGEIYENPITIDKTSVVRAMAHKSGLITPSVVTQSYIFPADVVNQSVMNGDYPDSPGIIIEALYSLPTVSIVGNHEDIFGSSGFYNNGSDNNNARWERPGSIELIYPDGQEGFQANAGMQGRSSRLKKRSVQIDFKRKYGPSKLDFPVFEHAIVGSDTVEEPHDSLVLRSGKAENLSATGYNPILVIYFRDPMVRDAEYLIQGYGTRNLMVHLYINGLYWGLYNLTEKQEIDFFQKYFGGEEEEWFEVKAKDRSDFDGNDGIFDKDHPGAKRYTDFLNFIASADISDPENYTRVQEDLDIYNFTDYLIFYNFYAVGDWPDNNWTFCMRGGDRPLPGRFLAWDAEKAWFENDDNQSYKHGWYSPWLRGQGGSNYQPTIKRIWQGLIQNEEYRLFFSDRLYRHTHHNGVLTDEKAQSRMIAYKDHIDLAVRAERMRWGDDTRLSHLFTHEDFQQEFDRVMVNIQGNVEKTIKGFRAGGIYPDLDPPVLNQHGGNIPPQKPLLFVNPNARGDMYYTIDGTDPRGSSLLGEVSETAVRYTGPFALGKGGLTLLKARVLDHGEWSPVTCAWFNGDPQEFEDYIADVADLKFYERFDYMFKSFNFGTFHTNFFPWIFHNSIGYFYVVGDELEWIYHLDLGWLWMDPDDYPLAWDYQNQNWIWFYMEGNGSISGQRYYYDFGSSSWIGY
ncbi:MAG: chitobiase/beta-hexosaminidase C-terminal domain-containing protein [Puniceicoccaceae bacterium]